MLRARPAEVSSTAADWSTRSMAFMYFVYGKDTMRLLGPGRVISSALRRVRNQAGGLAAATSLKPESSSPTAARCASRLRPWCARRAFS